MRMLLFVPASQRRILLGDFLSNEIYDAFSKEFDTTLRGYTHEYKLEGLVFTEKYFAGDLGLKLFTDRVEIVKELARALVASIKNKKRIVIYGEKGIGKSTLLSFIKKRGNEDNGDFYYSDFYVMPTVSIEKFKLQLIQTMCEEARNQISDLSRQEQEKKETLAAGLYEIKNKDDLENAMTEAKKHNFRCGTELDLIKEIKTHMTKPVVLSIDDYQTIFSNSEQNTFLQRVLDEVEIIIPIYTIPTDDYAHIKEKDPEFVKDIVEIKVPPFSPEHLCELLAKRIMFTKTKRINPKIDWEADILPFEKDALLELAISAKGNPLRFIHMCHDAYLKMLSAREKRITLSFIQSIQKHVVENNIESGLDLTDREKQLYQILLERKNGASLSDIQNAMREKFELMLSKENIIQRLANLIEKKYVRKTRLGVSVRYSAIFQSE